MFVGGNIEGEDLEAVQDGLDLRQQPRRALPGTAIAEFRRGDDADTDRIRTHFGDTCGDGALRISGKLGDDIGVEHIEPAHRSMAFAGSNVSSTSGNWSSGPSGCKDARTSRRFLRRTGSIMRRSPSRWRSEEHTSELQSLM